MCVSCRYVYVFPYCVRVSVHTCKFSCVCVCVCYLGDLVLTKRKAVLMSPLQLHCVNKRMTLPLGSSGEWEGGRVGGRGASVIVRMEVVEILVFSSV